MELKQASRKGVKALVGLYGKSGSGKTLTSLFLARGLVGPEGKIALIDTESGRGSIFADIVPGGYSVIDFDSPFSPGAYTEAIESAEKQADVIVVDSLSHEWSGVGGILDWQDKELDRMAGDNWSKRETCKMAAWIKPKQAHKRFIDRLLRLKCPLICCLRGEEKTHIDKGAAGEKTKVITDQFSSPIFDQRFIFEMLINFETVARKNDKSGLMEGGFVVPRKITHPSVAPLLPKENEQLGIKFGEALAAWCASAGSPRPVSLPASVSTPQKPSQVNPGAKTLKELEVELWTVLKSVRKPGLKSWDASGANQWLWDEAILSDTEAAPNLTPIRFSEVIKLSTEKLKG